MDVETDVTEENGQTCWEVVLPVSSLQGSGPAGHAGLWAALTISLLSKTLMSGLGAMTRK